MSDLKFPAEVEQRAISCSVASSDHMVCDVDGHVINDGRSTRSSELENHNTDLEGQTDEYADEDEDDDDDGLMNDKNAEATAAVRSRLSRLKSERVRLIEDMKNQRKRYEKYLDKLTCQLFKVLLSQKKLKSDCSSLIERVSALETDNKRLKEALDKWSSQSKGLNSLQQVMIEPINYLINRPTGGKNPVSTFISSISDQQNSGQTLEGQSELFFFHTHPPIIGQAIASLRRLQLLQSTSRCCRHSLADEATENFRPEKQGLENDYYNVDSLSQWLAKEWLPGGCSCSRCIRDNDDSQACYGSAYSALYDEVYQERPLVRLAEDKELDLMTEESQFNCSSGNVASVAGNNEFENCEGDDDDFDDDDDNKKLDARYDQVPDEFHHHCHHSIHQGYKDHNQDQRHGYQDNEFFYNHHHTPPPHHHNHHHHSKEEFKEHPYQNLKKPNINSESRESNTAASLYSGFSTFERILQPSKTTFSSPSLAPLSSSFYYTPGHYSNPVDKDSTDEIKAHDFCSKRRQVKKKRSRPTTRFSFDSEVTGRSDHQFDDSLDESQGQFTQPTATDCRFPTTATYRIKNATVARLVPIDRVIAEDVDEAVESNGIINSSDEPILRWSGTKADDYNCFNYGAEKANGSANESDVSFSCPWTLRMDRGIWADSNNHEGQNVFEDECGDYARLSKPLRKTIEKPIELRKNCSKNVIHSDNEEGEQQNDVTLSDSSKFLNAFGFLLSQDPSSLNSQLFLRDLVSGIDISPPNSESVSCLSLSPNSDEKAESLFESSSACLTDALGRSMDESSLSSFLVFETSGQGLQSTSATVRKDDEGPDYTALLNRNVNSKLPNHNPEDKINRGTGKPSETGRTNLTKNSIKLKESHLRPRFSDHQRAPAKDQQRRESKDLGSIDNNPIRFNHNSNLTTSQMTLGTSVNSAAVPAQNGSPGKSSVSFSQLNSLPSPVLRKANLFPNSKIPGSPNTSTRTKNSTPNHSTPSSIQNTLHQSMSVPFRNLPAPNRQSSRNSLPPLNQIRTPNCKPASLSKAGGFFRLNSKPIGSTSGIQSADIGQSVKTSPKSTTKIFKFSSPKTKRSSVTLTLHGNTEEVDHVTPPGGTGKKSGVCKTV